MLYSSREGDSPRLGQPQLLRPHWLLLGIDERVDATAGTPTPLGDYPLGVGVVGACNNGGVVASHARCALAADSKGESHIDDQKRLTRASTRRVEHA